MHHFISALSGTCYNFPWYYWTTSMYSTTWIQNWRKNSSFWWGGCWFWCCVAQVIFTFLSITMCHWFCSLIRAHSSKKLSAILSTWGLLIHLIVPAFLLFLWTFTLKILISKALKCFVIQGVSVWPFLD